MLNKEEKRVMDVYILPQLKKIKRIYFDMREIYEYVLEMPGFPEGEYNKKVFPYRKVMSDIYDAVFEVEKWVERVRRADYVKKQPFEEKWDKRIAMRERRAEEEDKIREEAFKNGQKKAVKIYNQMKTMSMKSDVRKEGKIHKKAYQEGLELGKEVEHLTDEQVLRKAETITLKKKLGF